MIKAVILAAGKGMRLQGTAGIRPKSLLPIGPLAYDDPTPATFLERQIECLRRSGVDKIAVVVGYEKQQIYQKLASSDVVIIENTYPNLGESGSLHSFQFAARSSFAPLDNVSNTLVLDADIIYEQRLLDLLLTRLQATCIFITRRINGDNEEVRVYGHDGRADFIGKGLSEELTGDRNCLGEAIGIIHLAPEDHHLAGGLADWLLGNPDSAEGSPEQKGFGPAKTRTEHEELSQRLMMLGKMQAVVAPADMLFMEVDYAEEYRQATTTLYPQILKADADYAAMAGLGR